MEKISVFYDHILEAAAQTGRPVLELLHEVRELGITGLEIHLADLLKDREQILEYLDGEGMCISCICEHYNWGEDPDLTHAKQHVDTAYELGVKNILVVPGRVSEAEAKEMERQHLRTDTREGYMGSLKDVEQMIGCLRELVAYAEKKAEEYTDGRTVNVTLEDFDDARVPCGTLWQVRYLLQQVPGLKFTMDCGNFAYSDEDAYPSYRCLDTYVVHIHCKDRGKQWSPRFWFKYMNHGLKTVPVGKGYVEITEILEQTVRDGYDGFYAIEHFGAKDQMKYIRQSVRFLQRELKLYREVEESLRGETI